MARAEHDNASDSLECTNGVAETVLVLKEQHPPKQRASVATTTAGSRACERRWCLRLAVAYASARTVVAAWVSRARRDEVEAVRRTCVQIWGPRNEVVGP
jgi:hypothetical protein